jgi:tRNA pseudouridine55 synthase
MTKQQLEGVLAVMKPAGWTSHDVVAKVRRLVGVRRIGHTGTLDPGVTGVLPLCIGRATRMVEYIQELPKQYEATVVIGLSTDTEDLSGTVIERVNDVTISEADVRAVVSSFLGEIEQVPPMYSAVKIDGKRLYELARKGEQVERKARKVTIHELELLDLRLDESLPEFSFRVTCSKGTYIRTLCVDIGRKLGFPAVMKELIRTKTGSLTLEDCLSLEQIAELSMKGTLAERLIPADRAVGHLPIVQLNDQQALQAAQGQKIRLQMEIDMNTVLDQAIVRVYDSHKHFIGLFEWKQTNRLLSPHKIFCEPPTAPV